MHTSPVTRRLVPAAASALALALVLGGCGSSDGGSASGGGSAASQSASSSLLPQAEGTTEYPLTLSSPWGETTLEKRPERVAVLTEDFDSEYLSMLQTTPVFAPEGVTENIWMRDAFPQKVETLKEVPWGEPPYEAVAAAKPDVIIATHNADKEQYDRLKAIAPVVSVGGTDGKEDTDETWKDRITRVGEALDLKSAAEDKVKEHDDQLAALRDDHPEFKDKTITYGVFYSGDYGLSFNNSKGSNSEKVFSDMGFATNPNGEKFAGDNSTVSNEQLTDLDADVMLISDNSAGDGDKSTLNTLTDLELFKNVPVVKDGRTVYLTNNFDSYTIDGKTHDGNTAWALAGGGPLAQMWASKELAPYLSEAIQK